MLKFFIAMLVPCTLMAGSCADSLLLEEGYFRVPMPGQNMTAGFFSATNQGDMDCQLIAADMPDAGRVELHTHIQEDGLLKMREVPYVDLPAGKRVLFKKGGLHLMVMELKREIFSGEELDLELHFNDGSSTPAVWLVQDMGHGHRH